MKPLLVGEDNPYGARASGDRMCRKVMGLTHDEYLDKFDRVNLCPTKWSMPAARTHANLIKNTRMGPVVLLGAKVMRAFGLEYEPFTVRRRLALLGETVSAQPFVVLLPHPSGRCLLWNEPGAFDKARQLLREAGVL